MWRENLTKPKTWILRRKLAEDQQPYLPLVRYLSKYVERLGKDIKKNSLTRAGRPVILCEHQKRRRDYIVKVRTAVYIGQ